MGFLERQVDVHSLAGRPPLAVVRVVLKPAAADDVPPVRDLHARSFATLARSHHRKNEMAAQLALIRSPDYAGELLGANLALAVDGGGRIVATGGWQPMPSRPGTARIRKIFVEPALARQGLGRLMVSDAEARARRSGFNDFYVRANLNAVPLYQALGYREIAEGLMALDGGVSLPVVFMEKTRAMTESPGAQP